MGSHICSRKQNLGLLLRDLHAGERSRVGRNGVKRNSSVSRCEYIREGTCANPRKCEVLRCRHCRLVRAPDQGHRNMNGGNFQSGKWNEGLQEALSMGPRDPILESSSQRCEGSKSHSGGFVLYASSSTTDDGMNRNTLRVKLSMRTLAIAACFGGIGGLVTALLSALPPDFEKRWRMLFEDAPQAESPSEAGPQSPTVLFDRHGVVIATIAPGGYGYKLDDDALPRRSSGKSISVSPAGIPSWMWQAVVATEDRRFFKHQGVDPRGLSRAVLSLAASGGGSTITQQLVKNVVLTSERKWTRKLLEIILALVLEKQMSKWDILHLYLKKIYWGHGVYGIEGASALYFGKHPSLLTLGECAMLAGIIPAPELLSPYRDPSSGKKPQARALRRMVEAGFLDTASAVEAVRQPLQLAINSNEGTSGPWRAPYFVSEVLYELTQKYGWSKVACGGLQVHTTLDLAMQTIAEKVVEDHLVEYDNERIRLSEKGLQNTRERLAALQDERQEKLAEVFKAVIKSLSHDEHPVMVKVAFDCMSVLRTSLPYSLPDEHSVTVLPTVDCRVCECTEEQSGNDTKLTRGIKLASEVASSETSGEVGDIASSPAARKAAATVVKRFFTAEEYLEATVSKYKEEIKAAEQSRMEAAMVAIDPMSGAVRVLVGGRDYYEINFNRGTQAFRSPGSTFKPVVYLTALAEGFERDHVLMDEPFTIGGFTPENYDRKFYGQVTLEESLVYSLNVPTVRLCAEVGVDKVREMGRALGITTFLPYELALSLGGCEVTPMQLATVYATIAAGGIYSKPHLITRVESQQGQVLEEHKPIKVEEQVPVVNEGAVAELRRLLQAVVDKGTGRGARFGRPCAGKTGTSNEHRDVWFAGFTPEISCVVWLGYDDNAPVGGLHPATGASHAAPLWRQFMKTVHEEGPLRKFHDVGTDKHGSKARMHFVKRSRRTIRIGLHKIRKNLPKKIANNVPWKQVWHWRKASSVWEEQEKMENWVALWNGRATNVLGTDVRSTVSNFEGDEVEPDSFALFFARTDHKKTKALLGTKEPRSDPPVHNAWQ